MTHNIEKYLGGRIMKNVLVVKGNNRPADQAVSSKMYETFVANLDTTKVNVTEYDVFAENLPYFGQDIFNAFGKLQNGGELTEVESRALAGQAKARELVKAADVIVVAFPLWNQTIPAALQSFIDNIYGAGFTFKYNEQGQLVALMPEKEVILLNARGGNYSTPEMQPMEMAVNYLRNIFGGVFGMKIVDEVIIEGHNAFPDKAQEIIAAGMEQVAAVAKKLN